MKLLLIDMFGNALDMACIIERSPANDVSHVYVMADRMCTNTWAEKGVELVVKQRSVADILKFVEDQGVSMVCNFDPYAAEPQLRTALEAAGVRFFGTDAAFARTELDRVFFKDLLVKAGIKTPEILSKGSEEDVLGRKYSFVYPLVIKPSLSVISPEIVNNPEELEAHFNKVRKRVERSGKDVDWLVERYIDAADALSVNFIVGAGEYKVRATYRVDFVPKSEDNLVGVTTMIQPHPKEADYLQAVNDVVAVLACEGHCGFGFFQALMDKSGELYIIENNARPISCGVFDGVEDDVMPLINAAMDGGLSSILASDTYKASLVAEDGSKAFYSEGVILQHKSRATFYDEDTINSIKAIFTPFSLRKVEGGYLSEKILPPSVIAAVGASRDAVKREVAGVVSKLAAVE